MNIINYTTHVLILIRLAVSVQSPLVWYHRNKHFQGFPTVLIRDYAHIRINAHPRF